MSPAAAAFFSASSVSAIVATQMSLIASTFWMLPSGAMSALFIAAIMGLDCFLISAQSCRSMSSSHFVGSSGRGTALRASLI